MITLTDEQIDQLFEAVPNGGKISSALVQVAGIHNYITWEEDYYKKLFKWLPFRIQMIAAQWGLDDTVFGDEVCELLQEKGIPKL